MSHITITGTNPNYTAEPQNQHVSLNGTLAVVPPKGGCVLCFDTTVPASNGSKQHTISANGNTDIPFTGIAAGTVVGYTILGPGLSCPSSGGSPTTTAGQTITIDSGTK